MQAKATRSLKLMQTLCAARHFARKTSISRVVANQKFEDLKGMRRVLNESQHDIILGET